MKLEQFFKKNRKFINFLKSIKKLKLQKLKLGLVKFEITEFNYLGFKIWENLNIKYVNQSEKINDLENFKYKTLLNENSIKITIKILFILFLILIFSILLLQYFNINNKFIAISGINFFTNLYFSNLKLINIINLSFNECLLTFCDYYNVF